MSAPMPLHVLAYHLMCDERGWEFATPRQQHRLWVSLPDREQGSLLRSAAQLRKPTTEHQVYG